MRTYAEREVFGAVEVDALDLARRLVDRVASDGCRCHELARAVHEAIGSADLVVQDGQVGAVEHSWLRFRSSRHVLDVYRPGVLPSVILVDWRVAGDYRVGDPRRDIRAEELGDPRRDIRAEELHQLRSELGLALTSQRPVRRA